MAFHRFNIKREDKNNASSFYDRMYQETDLFLSDPAFDSYGQAKIDIKFFINEIAANFIKHDTVFIFVRIDLTLSRRTLDGQIEVTHDGNSFDPFSDNSECENIKAAANRITMATGRGACLESTANKFKLKFSLTSWNSN
jgi:hypothetical protein